MNPNTGPKPGHWASTWIYRWSNQWQDSLQSPTPGRGSEAIAAVFRFVRKNEWPLRATGFVALYAVWILAFRLLVLSFITYFLMSSSNFSGPGTRPPRFEEIGEVFGANELTLIGVAALVFVLLLRALNPLTSTTTADIFSRDRFKKRFLPGALHGIVFAAGVILAFLVSGIYRYLGFFIQFEEAPLALTSWAVRVLAIVILAYCEEFIFRQKVMQQFRSRKAPGDPSRGRAPERRSLKRGMTAALITTVFYCGVKLLQFDLGIMQMITLFLISLTLSVRSMTDRDFSGGAGFWSAMLLLFHPVLSLPVFGNDFAGLVLLKYQSSSPSALVIPTQYETTLRFLTGGAGGPLSGFAFQLLVGLDVARGILRYKKKLLKPRPG